MTHPKPHNYRIGTPEQNCESCKYGRSVFGAPVPGRPLMCHHVRPIRRVASWMVCDQWQKNINQGKKS
jgi:hypothetical protein